ncbi:MAG TPA: TonB-dependent receptor [Rhodocyclaceae bacterium]
MASRTFRLAGLALSLASCAAAAENAASIEDLLGTEVQGASRFSQPLSEAPSAVSVVSADEIRQYGFRTVGEALASMRGVYTTSERDYTYVGIRGFARPGDYNTRLLFMTDGVRRNDPLYDDAFIGNEAPVEVEWIKRLEFVPGPASALYGANAIFGVANAVMWSGADLDGTRVRADAGTDRTARLSVLSGQAIDGGDWMVGVSAYGRRGGDIYFSQFDDPATSNGVAHGLDGERYFKAIAKLNLGDWQFDAGHSFRRKNIPTAYFQTVFDVPGNFVTDRYTYLDAGYAKALGSDWTANLRLHAGNYDYVGQYVYPDTNNRDTAQATWIGADGLLTYTGFSAHKLLIGGEAQNNLRLDQANFDLSPVVMRFDDHRRMSRSGVFVQDEWRMAPTWIANFGARADRVDTFHMTSPRAALIHRLTPAATLKLIYGTAFRAPNAYERFYNDGGVLQKVNPDLKPERITTQEIVADYALTPLVRLSADFYHYRIEDLIDQVTDPADGLLTFVNRSPLHAHGIELEADAVLSHGFHTRASITRQMVEQPFGEAVNSPKWLGKLLLDGPLWSTGWSLGLNLQAIDRRTSVAGQVPGSGVGNLVLTHKGTPSLGRWTVGIYNLSGRQYLEPASAAVTGGVVPHEGRQLRVSWELAR